LVGGACPTNSLTPPPPPPPRCRSSGVRLWSTYVFLVTAAAVAYFKLPQWPAEIGICLLVLLSACAAA